MIEIFYDNKNSPLDRLIELAKQETIQKEKIMEESEKLLQNLYKQLASLVTEFHKIRLTISNPDDFQDLKLVREIHLNNFSELLKSMNISIRTVSKGDTFSESLGKAFPFTTAKESSETEEIIIERMISPAVYLNEELIKGGELLLIRPVHSASGRDTNSDINFLKNISSNED